MNDQACIFNIQKFSIHDGPGYEQSCFSKDALYIVIGAQILNPKMVSPKKCGTTKKKLRPWWENTNL